MANFGNKIVSYSLGYLIYWPLHYHYYYTLISTPH